MKKSILFVAVLAAAAFTSCKKDRTCTCTTTMVTTVVISMPNQPTKTTTTTGTNSDVTTFTKARKGDAKAACLSSKSTDEEHGTYSHTTYDRTKDCTLK